MFLNDRMRKGLKFTGIILILALPFILFSFLNGPIEDRINQAMEERKPFARIEIAGKIASILSAVSDHPALPSFGIDTFADRFQQYAVDEFTGWDAKMAEEYEQAAKTDKIGFSISNLIRDKYSLIITIVYAVLIILSLLLLRELYKTFSHLRPKHQIPDPGEVDDFKDKFAKGTNWITYYETVVNYGVKGTNEFWNNLMESASIVNTSKRYEYLYMHLRNRIDEKIQKLGDMPLYDMIATGSPAAGFFGTLLGLIYIFSQSDINISSLAGSYQFWVGLKVAVITSLWGLLNLGLSVFFSYLHRRRTARLQVLLYDAAQKVTKPAAELASDTKVNEGQVGEVSEYGTK